MEVSFANPRYLLLMAMVPLFIFLHFYTLKHSGRKALRFANYEAIRRVTGGKAVSKNVLVLIMRIMIIAFLVLAVTGTTLWYTGTSAKYDMVIAIDASSSMLANDYTPNRLEAAKNAAGLFVDNIKGDVQVGVVAFSGAAFIEQEPTIELDMVKDVLREVQILEIGGTDLGQAIVTSANILKVRDAPKIIVLMTDGRSNVGIDPLDAIDRIGQENIMVYPIGIATGEGGAVEGLAAALTIDEGTLQEIADRTGGKYFHATSVDALENAFDEISQFDKKKLKLDISPYLLLIAVLLLFLEWGLANTKYKIL